MYISTKEPINYRGPEGIWTLNLAVHILAPIASGPERLLHATEIDLNKVDPQWSGKSAQRHWLHMWNEQMPIPRLFCIDLKLRPGAGDIHLLVLILMAWHRETHIYPQRNR